MKAILLKFERQTTWEKAVYLGSCPVREEGEEGRREKVILSDWAGLVCSAKKSSISHIGGGRWVFRERGCSEHGRKKTHALTNIWKKKKEGRKRKS